ncbi:DUF1707 SHOCT-like domain-containing protein [Actinoplanes sp. URMC 104]|uniref:DUF1707 SHOCT-like domain-containing protein n=1 Tax=Actinoplanes sp. URMC 104 TaxID=3423409 RepID=UPI003F19FFB4
MGREQMRAGDGDRKAVADQLKTALDEGRLDLHEYDERLQRTYAAKTYADLDGLLDDLPGTVPVQHSQIQPAAPSVAPVPAAQGPDDNAQWVGRYAGVVAICVLIWAITSIASGELLYFWPIWTMIPLILGFFSRRFGGGRGR